MRYFKVFLLMVLLCVQAASANNKPGFHRDLEFPQRAEKTWGAALARAEASDKGPEIVEASINWGLAKAQQSSDSLQVIINRIAQAEAHTADPAAKAMLETLMAQIYTQIYERSSYTIDRRPNMASAGNDYSLWSKAQFQERVDSLLTKALSYHEALQGVPISQYSNSIDLKQSDKRLCPTLYDFVCVNAIEDCQKFITAGGKILNERLLSDPDDASLFPKGGALQGKILEIYADRAAYLAQRQDDMAYIYNDIERLQFIKNHVFMNDDSDTDLAYRQTLMKRYNEWLPKTDMAVAYLLEINGLDTPEYYGLLSEFSKEYSNCLIINKVQNRLKKLAGKSARLSYPTVVAPGKPFEVNADVTNGRRLRLDLYDVTHLVKGQEGYVSVKTLLRGLKQPAESAELTFEGETPFKSSASTTFTLPKFGKYIIMACVDGEICSEGNMRVITGTDLLAGVVGLQEPVAVVVNPLTGKPEQGVSVEHRPWNRRSDFTLLNTKTDANGLISLGKSKSDGEIHPFRGDDKYSPVTSVISSGEYDRSASVSADLQTALSLYHPGDTVQFSAVAFARDKDATKYRIADGIRMKFQLRDANWQIVGTSEQTTDEWGRVQGEFVLPTEGLQGGFSISAIYNDSNCGSIGFTVSDYRLPTFSVSKLEAKRPATLQEPAVISGRATTFAGFPVGDAQVKVSVSERAGFWYWSTATPVFAQLEGKTQTDGTFAVTIPADVIAASPAPTGLVVAEVAVTSADGETQTGTVSFNLGKPYTLKVSIPASIHAGKPFKATVAAVDYRNNDTILPLKYEITGSNIDGDVDKLSGTVTDGNLADIIAKLPVGMYTATFIPVDPQQADPVKGANFTVWSATGKLSPQKDDPMWFPTNTVTADKTGKADVNFGSSFEDAYILMYAMDVRGNITDHRWIRTHRGMQTISVDVPTDEESRIYFWCTNNYKNYREQVNVKPATSDEKIKFTVETFRDRVTPGDTETLKIRILPEAGASARSAVMLSMTNMALNTLSPSALSVSVPEVWMPYLPFSQWPQNRGFTSASEDIEYNEIRLYQQPEWDFAGYSFALPTVNRVLYIRGVKNAAMASKAQAKYDDLESVNEMSEEVSMDSAPLAAAPAMGAATADGGTVEEEAADVVEDKTAESNNAEYRPAEIPLAFFRPILQTAEDGSLEVTYRVPDANTTWQILGAAYNRQLHTAGFTGEVVASKPIMVNVNAPRFLRGGDSVTVRAAVMNNTDSAVVASGVIEVVSKADGKVIASQVFSALEIGPKQQSIVEVPYCADAFTPAVIFRAKASAGRYTDGEQELVPILPSDQDVMESQMFFLAPDQAHFTMALPALGEGDKALLHFTENPTWQVVSALPGLREGKINSSVEAAHAIFSARVAQGIIDANPEIGRTLRRWIENQGDSALISNLERNTELKQVLLSATPWVQNAQNDTERMQRLALLLNSSECDRVVKDAMATLRKTRQSGGGWSWTANYPRVSEWATDEVLLTLGLLNRMGWLDADKQLNGMIESALKYIDAEAVKDYQRSPQQDFREYTFIRSYYPAVKQSTASKRISDITVQRCISSWKKHDIRSKAVDAMILSRAGYTATSRQVLESLREYATVTPEKGMWWQQLDHQVFWSMDRVGITSVILQAFAEIEPKSADVDRIRQWLILQKQNTDWGSSAVTTMAVAAILNSGSRWTVNPRGTAIHIGDNLVEVPEAQYATGEFTENISSLMARPSQLIIDRQANYPSFGSVVTMLRRPMAGLKAVPCAELSVEKQLSVYENGQWVDRDSFRIGDRVKVTLTLRADDDLSYVVISDPRAAGLQLAEQLPEPVWCDGVCFYRENRDAETNLYINRLNRGTWQLSYELFAAQAGSFTSGAAEAQSQYNPLVVAHSAGSFINVKQ